MVITSQAKPKRSELLAKANNYWGMSHIASAERARSDLKYFAEYVWAENPRHRPSTGVYALEFHRAPNALAPSMHDEWYDALTFKGLLGEQFRKTHYLHIESPRDHAKTTAIGVVHSCYRIGLDHNVRILVVTKTGELASSIVGEVGGNIVQNPRLKRVFPDLEPGTPWSTSAFTVKRTIIDKSPTMRGVGLHGSLTGDRSDWIILDDPYDLAEVQTPAQRRKVDDWIEGVVIPVLTPEGHVVFICTRWHYADFASTILAKSVEKGGNWAVKVYRPTEDQANSGSPLKSLWPEMWPVERLLARKEEIGSLRFATLMLNDPRGSEGVLLKGEWLRAWTDNPPMHELNYAGVDPATGAHDRSAIATIGFRRNPRMMWLKDSWAETCSFGEFFEQLKEQHRLYNYATIFVESNTFQKLILQQPELRGLPMVETPTDTNKERRIIAVSSHFEAGRMLVHPQIARDSDFREEWLSFPRYEYDDRLDSVEICVRKLLTQPSGDVQILTGRRPR